MKRFTVWILAAVTALLLCSCSESASSSEPVTETTSSSGVSAGFRFDWLSKITSITANVNGTEKSLPMQHSAVIELCNYFASKCEEEGYIHAIDYHFELSELQAECLRIDLKDGCKIKTIFPFVIKGSDQSALYETGTVSTVWIHKKTGECALTGKNESGNEFQVAFGFIDHKDFQQLIDAAFTAE